MKYDLAVEKQFENFINNTTCGTVLPETRLKIIKKYFQYCYEAGYAQGYTEGVSYEKDINDANNCGI